MGKAKKSGKAKYKSLDSDGSGNSASNAPRRSKRNRKEITKYGNDDDYKLRESIEEDGIRSVLDMDPDGNCLFRALSDQLYRDFGNTHADIRSDICDYLEGFEDDFCHFLVLDEKEDEDAKSFEEYVSNMRQDGEWGGNLELVAAARLYCRNITVFAAGLAAFAVGPGDKIKPQGSPLLLSFHENEHYNSVRDSTIQTPAPPIKTFEKHTSNVSTVPIDDDHSEDTSTTTSTEPTKDEPTLAAELVVEGSRQESIGPQKALTKKDPCPCASGQKYRKCCWAKQKHAARLLKLREQQQRDGHSVTPSKIVADSEEERVTEGAFRILKM
jgi:OTU domain-containing protein 3